MAYECPSCRGVLYDRRRKTCGFCGAELPLELLFTPDEIERLQREGEAADLKKEDQARMDAIEKARRDLLFGNSSCPGD